MHVSTKALTDLPSYVAHTMQEGKNIQTYSLKLHHIT